MTWERGVLAAVGAVAGMVMVGVAVMMLAGIPAVVAVLVAGALLAGVCLLFVDWPGGGRDGVRR